MNHVFVAQQCALFYLSGFSCNPTQSLCIWIQDQFAMQKLGINNAWSGVEPADYPVNFSVQSFKYFMS